VPTTNSVVVRSVVNAASGNIGVLAPGEIVVLRGSGIGPAQIAFASIGTDGKYGTQLAGTSVTFNGISAPILYASSNQTAAIVPYSLAGSTVQVVMSHMGQLSTPLTIPIGAASPGLFTLDATGAGQAAAVNPDGSINTATTPARINDVILLYATGEGQTTPAGVDGKPSTLPLPSPNLPVSVLIGGLPAQVLYAGAAPGLVAGLMQVNVRIPIGIDRSRASEVILRVGDYTSQAGVTIAIE
jgi:uncharacterized protein (TIGR03437 family)